MAVYTPKEVTKNIQLILKLLDNLESLPDILKGRNIFSFNFFSVFSPKDWQQSGASPLITS